MIHAQVLWMKFVCNFLHHAVSFANFREKNPSFGFRINLLQIGHFTGFTGHSTDGLTEEFTKRQIREGVAPPISEFSQVLSFHLSLSPKLLDRLVHQWPAKKNLLKIGLPRSFAPEMAKVGWTAMSLPSVSQCNLGHKKHCEDVEDEARKV